MTRLILVKALSLRVCRAVCRVAPAQQSLMLWLLSDHGRLRLIGTYASSLRTLMVCISGVKILI